MVVDGRRAGYSAGATLSVLGDLFLAIGAYDAVNLDGGGSSAMVINQQIVNRPSDNKERAVGNGWSFQKRRSTMLPPDWNSSQFTIYFPPTVGLSPK